MDLGTRFESSQDEGYATFSSQSTSASQFSQAVFDLSQPSFEDDQQATSASQHASRDQTLPSTSRETAATDDSVPTSISSPVARSKYGLSLTIHNVHARVDLGCELDLQRLCTRVRTGEWVPGRSLGVTIKLLDPVATAIVSKTGKMICLRTTSVEDCHLATRKVARIVQRCGYPEVRFIGFRICNIVAFCDLKFPINCEAFLQTHGQFATHSPEIFPGIFYRMIRPRVMAIIFVNGSVVLSAASNMEDLYQALDKVYEILLDFKKKSHVDGAPPIP